MTEEGGLDRLDELKEGTTEEPTLTTTTEEKGTENAEIQAHLALYEPVKRGLAVIIESVEKINKLKARDGVTANEKERKKIMAELDEIMTQTTAQGSQIKKKLEEIKRENHEYQRSHKDGAAKTQVRLNLYQTNLRKFHQVMNEYNTASYEFKHSLQARLRRQLKIVAPESKLTDEQVDEIVESGKADDVIQQALVSDNLQSVVQDIQERHQDILKLERQVQEIYELFRDLATLVDLQQETLDVIENRVQKAQNYTHTAEKELVKAVEYQDKARQRKCCLFFLVLGILLAILLPSILSAKKSA